LARLAARSPGLRDRIALRAALGSIAAGRAETRAVVLGLGLGLTVLAAVGQIDANLRSAISRELPERAPSFFFVDIQKDQIDAFLARTTGDPAVSRVESAPMLRGVITQINGRPAREVAGNHWVLNGDRGITYSATPPANARITAGRWWPADYAGPPQVSFAATEGAELGLKLGDRITVNILGRDIEAEITSFREVDFSTAGIGFILSMDPAALSAAPHTFIATVYADAPAEAGLLRDIGRAFPNVTAIGVKEAIGRVAEALAQIATATSLAAGAVLVTGFVVLVGAAAAGQPARLYEAAVMKVLGATRGRILWSFALRAALMGAAAGAVAVLAGAAGAWAVMRLVMEAPYRFEPGSALAIIGGGILAVLLAGAAFALRSLRKSPASVLRAEG
ncbi:MAG: FtsX-like permease family protein, partial [Paracoccaceae bacterium]